MSMPEECVGVRCSGRLVCIDVVVMETGLV